LTPPCCFPNIDTLQFGEKDKLDLTEFDTHLLKSVYFENPVRLSFKGFIRILSNPVVGQGILETTNMEQTLYSCRGMVIATRKICTTMGTRIYHLTSDLESQNLYHLYRLFDLALLRPNERYLAV
jgi:hypothetical protein